MATRRCSVRSIRPMLGGGVFVERNHPIEVLPPNGTDEALTMGIACGARGGVRRGSSAITLSAASTTGEKMPSDSGRRLERSYSAGHRSGTVGSSIRPSGDWSPSSAELSCGDVEEHEHVQPSKRLVTTRKKSQAQGAGMIVEERGPGLGWPATTPAWVPSHVSTNGPRRDRQTEL